VDIKRDLVRVIRDSRDSRGFDVTKLAHVN